LNNINSSKKQILLTNDDGIQSPGLWAAAEALAGLGYITVAAPRQQFSGAGRSHPLTLDGTIEKVKLKVHEQEWDVYAVSGSPAQSVVHGVYELTSRRPDLVVAGINYGENIGTCITGSGTVGAAMEAAAMGIPALAVSQQLRDNDYLGYSREVDFTAAGHFTRLFARLLLERKMPPDVDLFKLDIPAGATPETPWRMTRLSRLPYFNAVIKPRSSLSEPGVLDYPISAPLEQTELDSDVHALAYEKVVSLTPLSLDMTSRIDLRQFEKDLREA
jgi:5'-nucleotidase